MFPARASTWWKTAPLFGLLAVVAGAADPEPVFYPGNYREWTLTRFRFIGPESPQWQTQGGLRHYFANETALASWGRFRDGSVIVDERVHAKLNAQNIWEETGIAHVAVMRKDRGRHADTGGWYFNLVTAQDQSRGITEAQAKARCFDACHQAQEARDFVFSDPRR